MSTDEERAKFREATQIIDLHIKSVYEALRELNQDTKIPTPWINYLDKSYKITKSLLRNVGKSDLPKYSHETVLIFMLITQHFNDLNIEETASQSERTRRNEIFELIAAQTSVSPSTIRRRFDDFKLWDTNQDDMLDPGVRLAIVEGVCAKIGEEILNDLAQN